MRRHIKTASAVLILLFAVLKYGVSAYESSIKATVAPREGTVGQLFTCTVSIAGSDLKGIKIEPPEKKSYYPPVKKSAESAAKGGDSGDFVPLYAVTDTARDESSAEGLQQINIKVSVKYFRPGTYPLPVVKITGTNGILIPYDIPSVKINELNPSGQLEDVEPPLELSGNHTRIVLILFSVIVLAAAIYLAYRYFKKRKKVKRDILPDIPPIEIFLNEVRLLKPEDLIKSGRIKEYVFGISIIFRRYLSGVFRFDAAEMTTEEIAAMIGRFAAGGKNVPGRDEILESLAFWDISKFAGFTPAQELLLNNLDAVISVAKKISGKGGGPDVAS